MHLNENLFYSKATEMAKWFIFQAVIVVPAVGAISMILKSDSKLYSYTVSFCKILYIKVSSN